VFHLDIDGAAAQRAAGVVAAAFAAAAHPAG
jgi:hypothetical protein